MAISLAQPIRVTIAARTAYRVSVLRFEALTIGERRTELHQLVRLRLQIMRRLDEVDRSADLVLKAAAEVIEAVSVEPDRPTRLPRADWSLGL